MTVELVEIVEDENGNKYEEVLNITGEGFTNNVRNQTGNGGAYQLQSFIPGNYVVRFRYGDMYTETSMSRESLIHNGQDYKSTTYTLGDESSLNDKQRYELLTKNANISDAKDNEYRRIEVMAYSETMKNSIAEKLKYTAYDNNNITNDLKEFVNNTECFADTISFKYGIENYGIKESRTSTITGMSREHVLYNDFNNISYSVPNIDFGLSYRPENLIELTKKIKSIKVDTSSGQNIVNIEYDKSGKIEKEVGADKVQAINLENNKAEQGFRYVNIDEEILQGAKISIEYYLIAENIGEVDTISKKLLETGTTNIYTQLNTAYNSLNKPEASKYLNMDKLYKNIENTTNDYKHGWLLGEIYYLGAYGNKNLVEIAPITVEKILDWVDNDATFETENNNKENKYWVATTEDELRRDGLIKTSGYYKDEKGRSYTTDNKKNIAINVIQNNGSLLKAIKPTGEDEVRKSDIIIEVNSILSANSTDDDMSYDNIAEIAQFRTLTGRRTNFATTVGNINLTTEETTYKETKEKDSSGADVISLMPPTGSTVFRLFMIYYSKTIITISILLIAVIVGIVLKKKIFIKKIYK